MQISKWEIPSLSATVAAGIAAVSNGVDRFKQLEHVDGAVADVNRHVGAAITNIAGYRGTNGGDNHPFIETAQELLQTADAGALTPTVQSGLDGAITTLKYLEEVGTSAAREAVAANIIGGLQVLTQNLPFDAFVYKFNEVVHDPKVVIPALAALTFGWIWFCTNRALASYSQIGETV